MAQQDSDRASVLSFKPRNVRDGSNLKLSRAAFTGIITFLVSGVVVAHRIQPDNWPQIAIDLMHSLHGTGFALLALIVFWVLQKVYPTSFNYLVAAVLTFCIGVIAEAMQIPGPRDAHAADLIQDGLGAFGALGLLAMFDPDVRKSLSRVNRVLLPVTATFALLIACVPTFWLSYTLVQQQQAFPRILTFEHAWERSTFTIPRHKRADFVVPPTHWDSLGSTVGQFREIGRRRIFLNLYPWNDWRNYRQLSFVAASAEEPLLLDILIKESGQRKGNERPARFHKSVVVGADPERFTITFDEIRSAAINGHFDFARVGVVRFSANEVNSNGEAVLLLDDLKLEP